MVLILDVARFKYPPHWVPLTLLWEAMDSTDEATKLKRGYACSDLPLLSKLYLHDGSLLICSSQSCCNLLYKHLSIFCCVCSDYTHGCVSRVSLLGICLSKLHVFLLIDVYFDVKHEMRLCNSRLNKFKTMKSIKIVVA